MQRQQEREPAPKVGTFVTRQKLPRPRRSVGELLAAWLLVLLGGAWAGTIFSFARPWSDSVGINVFLHALYLAPGCLSLLAGITVFLRARKIAQAILLFFALLLLVDGWLFFPEEYALTWIHAMVLIPVVLFFFLGRWLGRQEDIEA